jgi:hypothetical protein
MNLPQDIIASLKKQVPKMIRQPSEKDVLSKFKTIKEEMIKEFLNHPVTQEIQDGPTAANTSNTLGGFSNLFAFIGFEESDDPIAPILQLFNSMEIIYLGEADMGNRFYINIPETTDVFSVTPMPWAAGRSWAEGIEKGISGLGYLLAKKSQYSRSGEALQSSVKIRSGRFKNAQYISALINKYKKRFDRLQ